MFSFVKKPWVRNCVVTLRLMIHCLNQSSKLFILYFSPRYFTLSKCLWGGGAKLDLDISVLSCAMFITCHCFIMNTKSTNLPRKLQFCVSTFLMGVWRGLNQQMSLVSFPAIVSLFRLSCPSLTVV